VQQQAPGLQVGGDVHQLRAALLAHIDLRSDAGAVLLAVVWRVLRWSSAWAAGAAAWRDRARHGAPAARPPRAPAQPRSSVPPRTLTTLPCAPPSSNTSSFSFCTGRSVAAMACTRTLLALPARRAPACGAAQQTQSSRTQGLRLRAACGARRERRLRARQRPRLPLMAATKARALDDGGAAAACLPLCCARAHDGRARRSTPAARASSRECAQRRACVHTARSCRAQPAPSHGGHTPHSHNHPHLAAGRCLATASRCAAATRDLVPRSGSSPPASRPWSCWGMICARRGVHLGGSSASDLPPRRHARSCTRAAPNPTCARAAAPPPRPRPGLVRARKPGRPCGPLPAAAWACLCAISWCTAGFAACALSRRGLSGGGVCVLLLPTLDA
jgi:hypothetical protein